MTASAPAPRGASSLAASGLLMVAAPTLDQLPGACIEPQSSHDRAPRSQALLPSRLCETATFGGIFAWWACTAISGSLTQVTRSTAFWVRDFFWIETPFWVAIFSELGTGCSKPGTACSKPGTACGT